MRVDIVVVAESGTSEPGVITLVTSRVSPFRLSLSFQKGFPMQRRFSLSLLVLAMASIVLSGPISWTQQDEPEVERKVVTRVAPVYPDLARKLKLRGVVKLIVVIAPDGRVRSTEVMGGNPVLTQAAVEAVRTWRYEAAPEQTHALVELRFDSH